MTLFRAGGALNPDEYGSLIVHRPELDHILNHIENEGIYIALRSPRQTGKTTLLFQLMTLLHGHDYGVVHLNLEGLSNLDNTTFYQTICADIEGGLRDLMNVAVDYAQVHNQITFSNYLTQLSAHTPQVRKLILMLDEIEGVPEDVSSSFFAGFRRFYHRGQDPSIANRHAYRKVQ